MIFLLVAGSACASPFWRQVEPFFAFLTTEDVAYLSQQVTSGNFVLYEKKYILLFSRLIYCFMINT